MNTDEEKIYNQPNMKLTIKLTNATYTMYMGKTDTQVQCTSMSDGNDGKGIRPITSTIGYYGPAQVDLAIKRIIAQETTLDDEQVGLKEFLKRYKAIHDSVNEQIVELNQAIRENKLNKIEA